MWYGSREPPHTATHRGRLATGYGGALEALLTATAFVLAAGLGTRLRPLTLHRPKALVPVCGVPMLGWALDACARAGFDRVIVNAHHHAGQVSRWGGRRFGCDVEVHVELEILGTGGGLRAVADRLADTFVVVNADVLADVDLRALRHAVPAGGAAMALRPSPDATKYGIVAADASGTVTRLVDVARATAYGDERLDTHFTGIHALDRQALALIPDGFACVVRTAYRALVPRRAVRAVRHEGLWLDVGDPGAYLAANLSVLRGEARPGLDAHALAAFARTGGEPVTWGGAQIEGAVWIGAGATVEGATLEDCVIGEGAKVPPGVTLRRCVVWDGCTVTESATDAVFFGEASPWTA